MTPCTHVLRWDYDTTALTGDSKTPIEVCGKELEDAVHGTGRGKHLWTGVYEVVT
jgi:hypothetical protein